jgi:hypothetical protein
VAATRVESASGTQVADLGGQMGVRGPLRDAIAVLAQGLRPALFPEGPVEHRHVSSRRCLRIAVPAVMCMWFGVLLLRPTSRRRLLSVLAQR